MNRQAIRDAAKITGVYIAAALAWIIASDEIVDALFDPWMISTVQTYKGVVYVVLTSFLLAGLIYKKMSIVHESLAATEKLVQDKQMLVKEVHHRVKNNMQLMVSLINLQQHFSAEHGNPGNKNLEDIHRRFRAMAIVHELAYHSDDLQSVSMKEYFETLFSGVSGIGTGSVSVSMNVQDVLLPVARAIPVGLIFMELAANVYQHAFPEKKADASLNVSLEADEKDGAKMYRMVIADNGIGMPELSDVEETLGFSLVRALVQQLNGTLSFVPGDGTTVEVVFSAG